MPDPHDPRPTGEVTLKLAGRYRGFDADIILKVDIRKAAASVAYLEAQGFEPPPRPVEFDRTPEGLPICPRHGVPMKVREKQGDTWHSHKVTTAGGEELFCRGYPGPSSPGYYVEAERERNGAR
jgi:hypothetical protein